MFRKAGGYVVEWLKDNDDEIAENVFKVIFFGLLLLGLHFHTSSMVIAGFFLAALAGVALCLLLLAAGLVLMVGVAIYAGVRSVTAIRLAAWAAGAKRHPHQFSQYLNHYLSAPTTTKAEKRKLYRQFLYASLKIRGDDLLRPVDWLVATNSRVNAVAVAVGGMHVIEFVASEGLRAWLNEGVLATAVVGGGVFVLLRWLHKTRVEVRTSDSESGSD
ncbi:hypothetical protein [Streptomyces sp. NPDC091219]|uniref:hypothetical protein n=1 Tax=Streptomyces sp. NPDC091219 TaxID=3155193 RepID=UPI00344B7A0B